MKKRQNLKRSIFKNHTFRFLAINLKITVKFFIFWYYLNTYKTNSFKHASC